MYFIYVEVYPFELKISIDRMLVGDIIGLLNDHLNMVSF